MKKLLALLILIAGVQAAYGYRMKKSGKQQSSALGMCYCAVKCGPRPVEVNDDPREFAVELNGKKEVLVLCAQRDQDILEKNSKKCKIKKSDIKQLSSLKDIQARMKKAH